MSQTMYPWLVKERALHVSAAPRALAPSHDRRLIAIGCQDGRVLVGAADPSIWDKQHSWAPLGSELIGKLTSVRAICAINSSSDDSSDRSWLVGYIDGLVAWLRVRCKDETSAWTGPKTPEITFEAIYEPEGAMRDLSFLTMLDGGRLLASYAAEIVAGDKKGWSEIRAVQWSAGKPHIDAQLALKPSRLMAATKVDGGWMAIAYTGEVWLLRSDDGFNPKESLKWEVAEGVRPQLVVDASPCWPDAKERSMFVSADVGTYEIALDRQCNIATRALRRNGTSGTGMGICRFTIGDVDYVWLCDSLGATYLMQVPEEGPAQGPVTAAGALMARQMHAKRPRPPAVRALAISSKSEVWIWQTCRDDTLWISSYIADSRASMGALTSASEASSFMKGWRPGSPAPGDPQVPGWAIVAALFEPPPDRAALLWEFLSHPNPNLALAVLEETPKAQLESAIAVWVQALVSSILRMLPEARDNLVLGVIHWLRALESASEEAAQGLGRNDVKVDSLHKVAIAARAAVLDVRRWTFLAPPMNALAVGIGSQVRRLARLGDRPSSRRRAEEERLARTAVLFRSRVDEEWRDDFASDVRGPAYAVAQCAEERIAAVLWRKSAIHLLQLEGDENELALRRLKQLDPPPGYQLFGRGLALWKEGGQLHLLTSARRDAQTNETLLYFRLGLDAATVSTPDVQPLSLGYTVHSMVRLQDGRFVLGCRSSGPPVVQMLTVKDGTEQPLRLGEPCQLPAAYRTADSWSRVEGVGAPSGVNCVAACQVLGKCYVAAGCADGQIFVIDPDLAGSEVLVGRLAVPVWSIACRSVETSEGSTEEPALRVYAGGADGQVAAYQRLPKASREGVSRYATLWATRESEAIVSLWHSKVEVGQGQTSTVIAVSRNGRATMFWDGPRIEASSAGGDGLALVRPRVPGQRLERYILRDTAFAVGDITTMQTESKSATACLPCYLPSVRILTITGKNRLRLLGLYQPKRSHLRKQAHLDLLRLWKKELDSTSSMAGASHWEFGMRRAESLHASAPDLSLLVIRALLPVPDQIDAEVEEIQDRLLKTGTECYPRPLRSFAASAKSFVDAERAMTSGTAAEAARAGAQFTDALGISLREAFEYHDRALFKEIMEAAFRRFNFTVKRACDSPNVFRDCNEVFDLYLATVACIEEACRRWLETDSEQYAQVQITRIKNVVDGDVFRALTNGAVQGSAGTAQIVATADPFQSKKAEVVQERVRQVHTLLMDGHPLVPLEALRAVNLSLVRASFLRGKATAAQSSVSGISALLGPLGSFASQASASANIAMLHEITRCYAIALHAAPELAIDVGISLRAARVPELGIELVKRQAELLEPWLLNRETGALAAQDYEGSTPKRAFDATVSRIPATTWLPADLELEQGSRFAAWYAAYVPILEVVSKLDGLRVAIESRPQHAMLEEIIDATLVKKITGFSERYSPDTSDGGVSAGQAGDRPEEDDALGRYFGAHYALWSQALKDLEARLRELEVACADRADATDAPRPAIVLISDHLEDWAAKTEATVEATYRARKLHDPHRSIYVGALRSFARAVRDLPRSAAVQRALVASLLGHHLIESLDDQVFALVELSRVLAPVGTDSTRSSHGTVERFVVELGEQALRARNAPKNLRSLYRFLGSMDLQDQARQRGSSPDRSLAELATRVFSLGNASSALLPPLDPNDDALTIRAEACLEIALTEIEANHHIHGDEGRKIRVRRASKKLGGGGDTSDARGIEIECPFEYTDQARKRIEELRRLGMQRPVERSTDEPRSNGTGLYLAQLAAAVVGWQLRIEEITGPPDSSGVFVISLIRQPPPKSKRVSAS